MLINKVREGEIRTSRCLGSAGVVEREKGRRKRSNIRCSAIREAYFFRERVMEVKMNLVQGLIPGTRQC